MKQSILISFITIATLPVFTNSYAQATDKQETLVKQHNTATATTTNIKTNDSDLFELPKTVKKRDLNADIDAAKQAAALASQRRKAAELRGMEVDAKDSAVNAILEKVDTIISPLNNQNHDLGGAISLPTKISQKSDDSDLFALPSDQLKPSLADAMASADARAEAARVNRIAAE